MKKLFLLKTFFHTKKSFNLKYTTFVSQHFKINTNELVSFLDQNRLSHRLSGSELVVKECPFCHDTKGLPNNQWKLYISKDSGAFNCFRCGNKGSWYDFKMKLRSTEENIIKVVNPKANTEVPNFKLNNVIIEFLAKRGISAKTAEKYGVGGTVCQFLDSKGDTVKQPCITFPMKAGGKVVRQKIRSIMEKSLQKLDPVGGKWVSYKPTNSQGFIRSRPCS